MADNVQQQILSNLTTSKIDSDDTCDKYLARVYSPWGLTTKENRDWIWSQYMKLMMKTNLEQDEKYISMLEMLPLGDSAACQVCTESANLTCSKCKVTYYCSKDHQTMHWKVHQKICKEGVSLNEFAPGSTVYPKLFAAYLRSQFLLTESKKLQSQS
ncbi:hypothetical protein BC833DRAFT_624444 [Globomyces pollinis-pini]|nr:hypothetical protein BC833DRAFT_624444 [Globomyces pollinis-pini]